MATIRGDRVFTVITLALVGFFILVGSYSSSAQDKKKISWSAKAENMNISVQQALEIPDIAGHVVRITEARRTWPDGGAPTVEGQKVVEEINRSFSDSIAVQAAAKPVLKVEGLGR